jgi:hypothetical protein
MSCPVAQPPSPIASKLTGNHGILHTVHLAVLEVSSTAQEGWCFWTFMHCKDKIDCVIGTQFIVRASHSTAVLGKARDRPGTLSHANMWCKDECTDL